MKLSKCNNGCHQLKSLNSSSSIASNPSNCHLKRIVSFDTNPQRNKKNKFIPFVNERDGMNRIKDVPYIRKQKNEIDETVYEAMISVNRYVSFITKPNVNLYPEHPVGLNLKFSKHEFIKDQNRRERASSVYVSSKTKKRTILPEITNSISIHKRHRNSLLTQKIPIYISESKERKNVLAIIHKSRNNQMKNPNNSVNLNQINIKGKILRNLIIHGNRKAKK